MYMCDYPEYVSTQDFNSLRPRNALWYQRPQSTLGELMAGNPFGARPLPQPMLTYCQLDTFKKLQ